MAALYVAEYIGVGGIANFPAAGAFVGATVIEHTIAISGSSSPGSVFSVNTMLVRLHTDAICSIKFGAGTPVATIGTARMAANQTEYFTVPKGLSYRVAVISNT